MDIAAAPRKELSMDLTGSILGMGNPLLDISANVGEDILEKYGLEANNAVLAEEKHKPLYDELKDSFSPDYEAGGATQNSIRAAQWMLGHEGATSYFGAIGQDDFGKQMQSRAIDGGVNVQYFMNSDVPTGRCAVLVTQDGHARSLVADLSAANTYPVEHLKEESQWSIAQKARFFYIAGFFLTVSPASTIEIGKHAFAEGKTFCMNLSAPFLLEVPPFFEAFKNAMPYVDVYFGNEAEAATLAKTMGWDTAASTKDIAIRLTKTVKYSTRPRIVVFTQGSDPTIIAIGDAERLWSVEEYGVIPCPKEELLDTNGAGDAFVGGFIAGLAKGVTTDECVAMGNYCANTIIKRSGASFPGKSSLSFKGQKLIV
mmetsp:Transcript_4284/g.18273  ORF Transcript_4284/g.18273 Transcript_4284/m.18273 type:complete len:371 (-) Transcript_4284:4770-5882(-)